MAAIDFCIENTYVYTNCSEMRKQFIYVTVVGIRALS